MEQTNDPNLVKLKNIQEEIDKRLPTRSYIPSKKMEKMIRDFASGDYFGYFCSAANGTGKTKMGSIILSSIMFGSHSPYLQEAGDKKLKLFDPKYWEDKPKRARIICPAATTTPIVRELHDAFPKGRYTARRNMKMYDSFFTTDTGWEIRIFTSDMSISQFEGDTIGLTWIDEELPEAIYAPTITRMRQGGHFFITATPAHGISDYLFQKFTAGGKLDEVVEDTETGEKVTVSSSLKYDTMTILQAEEGEKHRGHLKKEIINQIIAETPAEEREARIFGRMSHRTGLIFTRFNDTIHTEEPYTISPSEWSVWNMCDPHPSHENAVIWVAMNLAGDIRVVDELVVNVDSVEDFVDIIKDKDKKYRVVDRIIDPSAGGANQNLGEGRSVIEEYQQHGLYYRPGLKQKVIGGIDLIKNAFSYKGEPGAVTVHPRLKIFRNCVNTIAEIKSYKWKIKRVGGSPITLEVPIDKADHCIENLRRFFLESPVFTQHVPVENASDHHFVTNEISTPW